MVISAEENRPVIREVVSKEYEGARGEGVKLRFLTNDENLDSLVFLLFRQGFSQNGHLDGSFSGSSKLLLNSGPESY